jgi:DegV family protein with EDD domain
MKIAISAESASDLSPDLIEKLKVHIVPFIINLGDESALDGEISPGDLFAFVDKTGKLPKTSAVNEVQFSEHFDKILKEGYDAIIHISISSKLSSAFENATKVCSNYPNVYVIDSLSVSTGIACLVLYLATLLEKKLSIPQILSSLLTKREQVQASFVLEKINYLYKGGRCSLLSYIGANVLGLKPLILVDDGKLRPERKYRGTRSKVVANYVIDILDKYNHPNLDFAFITYSSMDKEIVEAVRQTLTARGFKNIYETSAGCTVTSHCGENTLGILYLNDAI